MGETSRPPRRRLSAAERRAQIVAATVRVVAAEGCANASADAIAREAGVSKGLLWHYFGSQDELLQATVVDTGVALRETVARAIDMEAPAPRLIRQAMHAAAGLIDSHRDERRAVADIVGHLKQVHERFGVAEMEETYALQEQHIFGRGQREGLLRSDLDPRAMAVTYQSVVDGMLDHLEDHPELDAARFVDQVADVLLSGLTAHEGGDISG